VANSSSVAGQGIFQRIKGTGLGRPFQILWSSSSVSTLGDGVRLVALPLLAASITRSPIGIAAVSISGQIPWILTSLLGGAIADRLDRRSVMWVIDAVRAFVALALVGVVIAKHQSLPVLCLVAFLLGIGQTLFDNASHALLPSVIPKSDLESANGRLMSSRIVLSGFVGPPLGSTLFAIMMAAPFAVDAASFAIAAVLVRSGLKDVQIARVPRQSKPLLREIGEGIRWVAKHSVIRWTVLYITIVNFTQAATQTVLVLFALEDLGLGSRGFGVLIAAMGVGGLAGGLSGGYLRRRLQPGAVLAATVLVTIPIFLVVATTSNAILAGTMLALNSFAGVVASVQLSSLRQRLVPNPLLARVNSVVGMLALGVGLPVGSLVGGLLSNAVGVRAPFFLSAALIALSALCIPKLSRAVTASARDA